MSGVLSAEVVVPTSRVSLKPPLVSRPKRSTRVNMGYTAELALLLDVSTMGRLPPSFQVNRVSDDVQYEQGSQNFKESWVQPSHFCEGGGLGLFFKVERRGLRAGARIGVYEGRCNKNRDDYTAALVWFAASDYMSCRTNPTALSWMASIMRSSVGPFGSRNYWPGRLCLRSRMKAFQMSITMFDWRLVALPLDKHPEKSPI
jgi:hypothetical protein